jgi:hypothetical protein
VRSQFRVSLVALAVCALVVLSASAAQAAEAPAIQRLVAVNCKVEKCAQTETKINLGFPFGEQDYIEPKAPTAKEAEEEGFLQAGGRVPFGVTDFKVATGEGETLPTEKPTSVVKHLRTDVAPGLATDPSAVPECSAANFGAETFPGTGFYPAPKCAKNGEENSTQVGTQQATVFVEIDKTAKTGIDLALEGIVYNLDPAEGLASEYGVALKLPIAVTKGALEEYFAYLESIGAAPPPDEAEQKTAEVQQYYAHTLIEGNVEWGKQAKGTGQGDYHDYFEINVSPALPLISSRLDFEGTNGEGDFVTNATSCPGHNTTTLKLTDVEEATVKTEYTTPVGLMGCNGETDKFGTKFERLVFEPSFELESGTTASDQPDQLTTVASEANNPKANAQSQVKTASITLPEGMTLNPSAAAGLEACTVAEARIHDEEFGVACPAGSEIGTVSLDVPTLPDGSLTGSVYLGGPVTGSETGPITGPPYIIYIVANSRRYGVSVRLKAEVVPNAATGQLTTVFPEKEVPEQPFSSLKINFNRGALTSIANPLICGTPEGSATFVPVTGSPASTQVPFGASVTGCAASLPFSLGQTTEYETATAGAHNAYTFNLARAEGQQYLEKIKTTLPSGLVGEIPAVTLCAEPQAKEGTCGAASKIGTATVAAGSGNFPYSFTGPVYMTGPYEGAPFGLSIAVPAVAGPFNLGTVVTRSTININPTTARVTAETTLPTIVKGVPLRLRSISVNVNKQGFLLNPTNCSTEYTETSLTSTFGATQTGLTSPLAAEGCSSLAFKPTFKASTSGKHSKVNGASLVTTITQLPGQANVKSVLVTLPKALPSRLTTLQKACLAKTFEENPLGCAKVSPGSEVGTATAVTPTLPVVMKGPAFLVSHAGEEFPSLELVLEGDGVRVIVEGKTNIKKGITTTNFESAPDVPVSSITVNLPVGPHSALATERLTTNLCTAKLVMPTVITGQNGKQLKQNTIIAPTGCGVQIVGHKVIGNTLYLTIRTYAAGRISGSGSGLSTARRTLKAASKAATLKIPLSRSGRGRRRPFKVKVRVGFVPKKGAHSTANVTVSFR